MMKYTPQNISRDQALLALVVKEAGDELECSRGYLGRTALQKIMYFLQVFGVPMRYRFDVHHYGPFCSQILSDVDWLTVTDVIHDNSSAPDRYSNYRIANDGEALIDEFSNALNSYRETVHDIVSALAPWDPDRLELLSTLHYAYRELSVSLQRSPRRKELISRFCEFKPDRFDASDIDDAINCLKEAKLIK
jgi:uncharacterized protein YwgA